MANHIASFISQALAFRSTIDAVLNSGGTEEALKNYAHAKASVLEAAKNAANSWMQSEFNSAGARVLLENSALRTLIGALSLAHDDLLLKHEEFKQHDTTIETADIIMAHTLKSGPGILIAEINEYDRSLTPLATSSSTQALLQEHNTEARAALSKRYGAEPKGPLIQPY